MSRIVEKRPASLTEFVKAIESYQSKSVDPLWYRGCEKSTYKLLPGLYRHRSRKELKELEELETQLIMRFRQRSIPFHSRSLSNDWETLFFMQHYRIPTRLLDWTENPFIALYFAVMSPHFRVVKGEQLRFTNHAAVWILDPVTWNRHALSHQQYDRGVLAPGDEALKGYKPSNSFETMNETPVALYGAHNSPRIVAQRGVFTVFGQSTFPMEQVYVRHKYPRNCLVKLVLEPQYLHKLRGAILEYGITESAVFPDLDGLAKEIRRTFQFEV